MYAWSDQLTQNEVISASDHSNIIKYPTDCQAARGIGASNKRRHSKGLWDIWDIWHFRDNRELSAVKPQAVPVVALCLEVWRVLCPPAWKCAVHAVLLGSEAQRVTSKAGSTRRFWAWGPLPLIQVDPYSEKNSPTRFPSCAFTYFQRTAAICIMSNIETHISKGLNPKLERMMLLHAVSPQGISGSCPTSVFNVVGSGSQRSSSKSRVSR